MIYFFCRGLYEKVKIYIHIICRKYETIFYPWTISRLRSSEQGIKGEKREEHASNQTSSLDIRYRFDRLPLRIFKHYQSYIVIILIICNFESFKPSYGENFGSEKKFIMNVQIMTEAEDYGDILVEDFEVIYLNDASYDVRNIFFESFHCTLSLLKH